MGFPNGTVIKNPPANVGDARDAGSVPGLGRSPGVGNGNPLQCSRLENSMDRGDWWATVHEHTHTFSFKPPSHPGCHITLSRVPCAIQ